MLRTAAESRGAHGSAHTVRVLLVDVHEQDFAVTERLLAASASTEFELHWAPSYDQAIEALGRARYDVCLVDQRLGEHDGIELLRHAEDRPDMPPVVLLTNAKTQEVEREALAHGATECVYKRDLRAETLERALCLSLERGRVAASLRAANSQLRAVFERALDAMLLADDESRFLEGNPAALALLGVTHEQLRTMHVFDLAVPELRGATAGAWSTFLETGAQEGDFELVRADGTTREVEFRASANVTPGVHLSIIRDLSVRRRTERALRVSEARYRSLFEGAPEAILTVDIERARVTEANAAAEQLFGLARSELGRIELARLGLDFLQQRGGSADEDSPTVLERECIHAGGVAIPCEVRLANMEAEQGERLVRVTLIDMRERLHVDELRAAQRALEEENRRVHDRLRLRMELFARISHELRAPISAILGFSELLEARVRDAKARDFIQNVLRASRHLTQLVSDVLDFARLDSGRLDFRPEEVELRPLVEEVCAMFDVAARNKRVALAVHLDPTLSSVHADPTRLRQVLYNYISNAVKFTSRGGNIEVRVAPEAPHHFRVEVRDDGCGVAPDDLARLFVDFVQVGPRKGEHGTGLGLALTKQIVTGQGGHVGVESTLGRGSTFYAILPKQPDGRARPA